MVLNGLYSSLPTRLLRRERNFATNEKEALACLWAIECWEKFLLGRHFTLRTDHGALLTLLHQHTASHTQVGKVHQMARTPFTLQLYCAAHRWFAKLRC